MTIKIVLSSVAVLGFASAPALAGDCPSWHDDFESYATGAQIGNQGPWEMWGAGDGVIPPLEALVLADPASSGQGNTLQISGGQDGVVRFESDEAAGEPLISGAHSFRTLVYNPSSESDQSYFIALNFYDYHTDLGGGASATNWAIQANMDRGAGTFTDEGATGASIALPMDEWTSFEVLVDVDNNKQFFFVNGDVFYTGAWAGHVSADPGFVKLDALDFWGNSAGPVYYDDVSINYDFDGGAVDCPVISGGCCLVDGTCIPETAQADCEATEGYYAWNLFAPCTDDLCAEYLPGEGWDVTAPFSWQVDTTFQPAECALFGTNDETFKVTIPYAAPWTFSTCAATESPDSYLALGSAPCGEDIATNDDSCGVAAELVVDLEPGTYYLTVTSAFGEEIILTGEGMTVSAPCVASYTPMGDPESEPCGDDLNGGCNMDIPAYEAINLGQRIAGTVWIDAAGTRDTDWYEFTNADGNLRWAFVGNARVGDVIECGGDYTSYDVMITQAAPGADTVMELSGESTITFGMISDEDNNPSTDCATVAFISPAFTTDPCGGVVTRSEVIESGASCSPTMGDTDDNGVVDVTDLLNVLGDWGCSGDPGACLGDTNCDGETNVSDLLDVLGNWD